MDVLDFRLLWGLYTYLLIAAKEILFVLCTMMKNLWLRILRAGYSTGSVENPGSHMYTNPAVIALPQ
jgi:hypothetical protein